MDSRERVLTAFARSQPDRVPIGFAGVNEKIKERLTDYFKLNPDDMEGLLRNLGVDLRGVFPVYNGIRLHKEVPGRQVDPEYGIRTRWVEHHDGGYWDYCDFPLRDADEQRVAEWPMPSPDNYDYDIVVENCKRHSPHAVYLGGAGLACIMNTAGFFRGMEQVFVDLATDDPAGLLLIDRFMSIQYEVTRRALEKAYGMIDFLWIGEDLGSQNSPLIGTHIFKKHIKPRHKKFIELAKSCNLPVMMHTCGSSSWAYEDYIEMGVNVMDTLQPEAKDMSPSYLKKRFGDRLAFHGCISTAGPLAYGTEQDVIDNLRSTLEIMMPGGGYCMAPTHSIQDNTPVENVITLYHAARRYGRY